MSQVIIDDIPPYTQATASLNQVVFGTTWTANTESDVVVYVTPSGDDADDATQVLSYPSDYSVDFIGDQLQVQVTLVTPSAASDRVTITRMTPADRMNLYSNTNFLPSMLNNDFGILTLVDQQAQLVNQMIGPRYNYSAYIDATPGRDSILPILGANQTWSMNAAGTAIEAITISSGAGTITEIDTGLGLTGGPITSSGTLSFAAMDANSFWGNITASSAVPTMIPTTYFLKSANNLSDLASAATARSNLGLVIGTNVEAWSAALDSLAGLTTSANQMLYLTGSNAYATLTPVASGTLITSAGSVPSFSQTLPSTVQTNITRLGAQAIAFNMNSHQINNVTDPTNPQDAATLAYVSAQTAGVYLPLIGGTMAGAINMGNHKITAMTDPSASQDAVTLSYLNTALALKLSLTGGTLSGAINMGSNYITNLLDPVNPQDAATRNYVDSVAVGLNVQPSCFAASTTALTVTYANGASGIGATLTNAGAMATFSIDSVSPAVASRILIKNQASTLQNGIYTVTNVGSGAANWILTRATDYDQPSEIQPGDLVIINNGTVNAGTSFIETASVAAVGTDAILFSQFTFSATAVLLKANNLSDVANTTTSFNNISPMTTKGDLIGYSSQNVRLAVGITNGQILQVSSGAATGLAWSTATYPVTTTANQILYSSATNTVTGIATLAGGVLVTDASGVPSMLTNPSVAGKMLQSANAAIAAWSTPTYPSASGTSGKLLISDGTNNVYSTSTFPTSAGATANKVLLSDGTNFVLSTPTFPNASATSRKITVSDGTNWVASTETYAVPGTSGNVMTSNGTNWTSAAPVGTGTVTSALINQLAWYSAAGTVVVGLATANSGVLVTSSGGVPSISSTLPADLSITTPKITTSLKDVNGNTMLAFSPAASAVNYLTIVNAATGGAPQLSMTGANTDIGFSVVIKGAGTFSFLGSGGSTTLFAVGSPASAVNYLALNPSTTGNAITLAAAGSDSNINLQLTGKGTGGIKIGGFTDGSSGDAGYVGELISSVIASASAVTMTTNAGTNITSISLTAGSWDVWGNACFITSGTAPIGFHSWVSSTSATLPDRSLRTSIVTSPASTLSNNWAFVVPQLSFNLAATTTIYLSGYLENTSGNGTACGAIYARRRR